MSGASGSAVLDPGYFFRLTTVITLVGGTIFLMWLGEQITQRGIGNGISLIIFAGIVANLPTALASTLELGRTGAISTLLILVLIVLVAAVIAFIVFIERSQRRIVVQYPKRQVVYPVDTADNLKRNGGFVPGIRPGANTAEYLDYVLTRLTVVGAAYLAAVCILPELLISQYAVPFYFGGTSLLIVVTVTMDTVTQIQSHLLAHQYEGLIKSAKLRQRRQ
jgi:preprotein translocase subunit SecY